MKYKPIYECKEKNRNGFRINSIPVGYHIKLLLHEQVTWMIYDNLEEVKIPLGMWFGIWFDKI